MDLNTALQEHGLRVSHKLCDGSYHSLQERDGLQRTGSQTSRRAPHPTCTPHDPQCALVWSEPWSACHQRSKHPGHQQCWNQNKVLSLNNQTAWISSLLQVQKIVTVSCWDSHAYRACQKLSEVSQGLYFKGCMISFTEERINLQ